MTVGNTGVGVLNHSAGTFTATNGLTVGYNTGSNGTYNLSGTGNLVSNNFTYLGISGTGLFHQTGGTATFNSSGLYLGFNNGGNGTYQLDAGSVLAAQVTVGESSGSTGTILQIGGTFTTTTAARMDLAENAGSSGSYTLGGTGSQLSTGTVVVGSGGNGVFTQNGGTFTVSSGNDILLTQYSGSQGSFNLNGGTPCPRPASTAVAAARPRSTSTAAPSSSRRPTRAFSTR